MSRGLTNAIKTLLAALELPRMIVLVEFETLGLRLTNWPTSITFENQTYEGSQRDTNPFSLEVAGVSENLNFEAPSAKLTIASVNGWFQAHVLNDQIRGDICTITLLYSTTGGDFLSTGWQSSFACDAEEADSNEVSIRLSSLEAARGDETPRRTTQTQGCQWNFQVSDGISGCTFRYVHGTHRVSLATCDRTFDGPNGCLEHFPDVIDPLHPNDRVPRVKPFGAFPGNVDHRLVGAR